MTKQTITNYLPTSKQLYSNCLIAYWRYLMAFCIFACPSVYGQYTKYRNQPPPPWKIKQPTFAPTDSMFQQEDAVILSEKTEWSMNDVDRNTTCKKYIAIRFLTPNGLAKHNRIVIPESTDPSREYADLPIERRQTTHRPKYFDLEILYISARLIKPDGTVLFTTIQDKIETEQLIYKTREFNGYTYLFTCPKAEVGDVLEVQYQYYLPFLFDYRRIFFHGNLPKQEYELKINHHPREHYVWQSQNGGNYTDSTKTDKNVCLIWKLQKLAGCINETQAQTYRDLPHLQYYIHNKHFGVWNEFTITDYKPYTWTYYTHDLVGFKNTVKHKSKSKLSRKELALNKFYTTTAQLDTLLTPLQRWLKIQNTLNTEFDYQPRADAFANIDPRIAHLPLSTRPLLRDMTYGYLYHGIFDRLANDPSLQLTVEAANNLGIAQLENVPEAIDEKRLETINTETIHIGLLNRIFEPYGRVLTNDKRIAALDTKICQPLWGENRLFALYAQNEAFYITPKKRRFVYQFNELPFYLENSPSVHVAQLADTYNDPDVVQFFQTPNSNTPDNSRTTDVKMAVNLNNKEVKCEARVVLKGQYATLIRENYLYGTKDSSINQLYYQRPDRLSPKTTAAPPVIEKPDTQFPYRTQVRLVYADNTIINHPNDSTYTLSLQNWLQHVVTEQPISQKRHLPYYPDFQGTDIFRYKIVFDQDVVLRPLSNFPIRVQNHFGNCYIHLTQSSPTTIDLHAEFTTLANRVAPEQITDVTQIFDAIKAINAQKIVVGIKK